MKSDTKSISTPDKKFPCLALVSGILIAYAITCIFFIVCALLLRYTSMTEERVPLIVTISCVISVAVAGFDAANAAEKSGWLWGLIAGAVYAAVLMLIGALAVKGYTIDLRGFTLCGICVAGGGLGGIIGINLKKRKRT